MKKTIIGLFFSIFVLSTNVNSEEVSKTITPTKKVRTRRVQNNVVGNPGLSLSKNHPVV